MQVSLQAGKTAVWKLGNNAFSTHVTVTYDAVEDQVDCCLRPDMIMHSASIQRLPTVP
jgi:hypothetical protein